MGRGLAILVILGLLLSACTIPGTREPLMSGDFQVVAPDEMPLGLQTIRGHVGVEPSLYVELTDGGTYLLLTAGRQDPDAMVEVLDVSRVAASRREVRILAVVRKRVGAAAPTASIKLETTERWTFTARLSTPGHGVVELQGVPVDDLSQ